MSTEVLKILTDDTIPIRSRFITVLETNTSEEIFPLLGGANLALIEMHPRVMDSLRGEIINWCIGNIFFDNFVIIRNVIFFTDEVSKTRFTLWVKSQKK